MINSAQGAVVMKVSALKLKQPVIILAKWVYSVIAESCNSGQACYSKNWASLEEQRKGLFFYRGKREVGRGSYKQGGQWGKLGFEV